jgi:hypothetical protein
MKLDRETLVECLGACLETRKGKSAYETKFTKKEAFDYGVADGFYAQKGSKTKVVVFRGSDEFIDWIANLFIAKRVVPYGNYKSKIRVHSGWIETYKQIRNLVHDQVLNFDNVIITGQSLGASLATLCAVDIQYNFPNKNIACVPFGSPKVGNKAFTDSFDKRVPDTYRFVHGRDLIPLLPPFYSHVSLMREFGPPRGWVFFPSICHHIISYQQVENLKATLNID